jgi:hypothetical protein
MPWQVRARSASRAGSADGPRAAKICDAERDAAWKSSREADARGNHRVGAADAITASTAQRLGEQILALAPRDSGKDGTVKPCHAEIRIKDVLHICNRPAGHAPPHVFDLFKQATAREPVGFSNTAGLGLAGPTLAPRDSAPVCDNCKRAAKAKDGRTDRGVTIGPCYCDTLRAPRDSGTEGQR